MIHVSEMYWSMSIHSSDKASTHLARMLFSLPCVLQKKKNKTKKPCKFLSWCSWNLLIYQHMHILYVYLPVLSQKPCCYLWQRLLRKSPLHGNKCAHFFACHWHNLLHMVNLWKTKGYKNFTGLKLLILIFKETVLVPFSKLINTNPFCPAIKW